MPLCHQWHFLYHTDLEDEEVIAGDAVPTRETLVLT